jgi:hypothetical protein
MPCVFVLYLFHNLCTQLSSRPLRSGTICFYTLAGAGIVQNKLTEMYKLQLRCCQTNLVIPHNGFAYFIFGAVAIYLGFANTF